jgi:hypothetical protein
MPDRLKYFVSRFELALRWRLTPWALSQLERFSRADRQVLEWLSGIKADAVIVSPGNTLNSPEAEYLKAAKKLGIPAAVAVLSWDNLTTKGLIPFDPDAVLVWNDSHAEEAKRIHGIPQDRIIVTGSPFFDKWFEGENAAWYRHELCERLGLSAERPILLYLGSSANVAQNEAWLVCALTEALAQHSELSRAQVVVRPHPANQEIYRELEGSARLTLIDSEVPSSNQAKLLFSSLLRNAFAVVGINTSAFIDAIALDRPCYSVRTDRYDDTHISADHFRHLVNSNAITIARDLETLLTHLAKELGGSFEQVAERRQFVERFLRPRGVDVAAGTVAAKAIAMIAQGIAVEEINRRLGSKQG